jgi:hypothetical protein
MTIRRVFAVLLFAQLFNIAVRPTLDPDMWWHLRTGEVIWQSGIPRHDVFSYTVRDHQWITHEWLSQAVMWAIYKVGGLKGLAVVFAAFDAIAFWLVYTCCDGRPYLAGLLVIGGEFAAAASFGVRPQTFNLLMAAAFVHVVERVRNRRLGTRALFVLPLLTMVWANLHSGYLFGVVLLLSYAVGDGLAAPAAQLGERGLSRAEARLLAGIAVGCAVAALLNPNGWYLWRYPFGTLGSAAMQQNIAEWRSPDFHTYVYWPFALLMALGVVSWVRGQTRPSWTDVLLFLGTALGGLVSVRHIALFAVVSTPIIARSVECAVRGTALHALFTGGVGGAAPTPRKAHLNWALLAVGLLASGAWAGTRLRHNDSAVAKAYPVAAVDFLNQHGLAGTPGYNTYTWGGYLIWRGLPVFVDGRADVYGDEFLRYYLKTFRLAEDWRKPLDDFGVAYVLVERSNPLGTVLAASEQWREAYGDEVARVFVRIKEGTS